MKLFGIALVRPSFNQFTSATVLGVGLWLLCLGLARAAGAQLSAMDAGAALLVAVWSCVGTQLGIHVARGGRHLALNLGASALLLLAYQAAWVFA